MVVKLSAVYPKDEKVRQTFLSKDFGFKNPCIIKNNIKLELESYNPDEVD